MGPNDKFETKCHIPIEFGEYENLMTYLLDQNLEKFDSGRLIWSILRLRLIDTENFGGYQDQDRQRLIKRCRDRKSRYTLPERPRTLKDTTRKDTTQKKHYLEETQP